VKIANAVLRAIREDERRQSRDEFARDLVAKGAELGESVACDGRLIARWEDGDVRSPRPVYRRLLSAVTGRPFDQLGFPRPHARGSEPPPVSGTADPDFPSSVREGLDTAVRLWREDMGRRRFRFDAGFSSTAFTVPVLRWLTASGAESPESTRGGSVSEADVRAARTMAATFRRLDNLYGGGHVRSAVVGFLHGDVAPLLREGRYGEQVGRALFGAAAELTHLAGWMAYDIEEHGLAQRYLIEALRFAMAAGDAAFGGEVLAGMSHQAVHLGHAEQGVDLARAARQTAERAGLPALRAEAAVTEAHAHAVRGDRAACARALADAEKAYGMAGQADRPEWLAYLGEAYLAARFAHCFRDLGDVARAERFVLRSLDMDAGFARCRAFNTVLLATVRVQQHEIEEACAVGVEAVRLASQLRSRRAWHYVRELDGRLASHSSAPPVRAFREQARTHLRAAV